MRPVFVRHLEREPILERPHLELAAKSRMRPRLELEQVQSTPVQEQSLQRLVQEIQPLHWASRLRGPN